MSGSMNQTVDRLVSVGGSRRWLALAVGAVLCPSASAAAQTTWHVDNVPGDAYNPPAKSTVYATIQEAIDLAENGDTVLVWPGTYTSTASEVVNLRGKAIVVEAAVPYDTAVSATWATIDGQNVRRGIVATLNETEMTVVRGLRVWRGRASAGGGMYVVNGSPRIEGMWFQSNDASGGVASGGGLRLLNSTSLIQDCFFQGNGAGAEGGAIFNAGGAIVVSGCDFIGNQAPRGGGLFTREDASVVIESLFRSTERCDAGARGLGIHALDSQLAVMDTRFEGLRIVCGCNDSFGAALAVIGPMSTVFVSGCEFVNNLAATCYARGGAIAVGVPGNNRGSLRVVSSVFRNNISDLDGGAIAMQSTDFLQIDGEGGVPTIFENNSANRHGGAISVNVDWVSAGHCDIQNAVFNANAAGSDGGAIASWILSGSVLLDDLRFTGNTAASLGGAIRVRQDASGLIERTLSDAVFINNAAANGGAVFLAGSSSPMRFGRTVYCGNDPNDVQGAYLESDPNCFTIACADEDGNGYPDTCEIPITDCNGNGIPDDEELIGNDANNDGIPDDCQPQLTFAGLATEIVPIVDYVSMLPSTSVCWRVYATFRDLPDGTPSLLGRDSTVTTIYGNADHPLSIAAPAGFFQRTADNGSGGLDDVNTAADLPCNDPDRALRYDSFLTIDAECRNEAPVDETPGFPWSGFNASTNSSISTANGAIFVLPDSPQSRAGDDLRVLLMQLTTKSAMPPTGLINLKGRVRFDETPLWEAFGLAIPAPKVTPEVDCDANGVHDAIDIASGVVRDCNFNGIPDTCEGGGIGNDCDGDGVPDACEIVFGTAADTDGNGFPDNCECSGDVDRNGVVNVDDLLEIFASWGLSGADLDADLNGDLVVDSADLVLVLAGWGGCI